MAEKYDVIAVGARCAGSPTAMLLARKGYRVLLVDRAAFPSDTVSTHVLHPRATAALARWGLLDRLTSTGCPPIHTYSFDFGPLTIAGSPAAPADPPAYCPRRTVLDKLLLDAAAEAGAEVREGFTVEDLVIENGRVTGVRGHSRGGPTVTLASEVTVGADGRNSRVAQAVKAEQYHARPPLEAAYYSYWRGLPTDGRFEIYIRPWRGFAAAPTHDGLTMVIAGWPYAEFEANKKDVEGSYQQVLNLVPGFAERLHQAERVAPVAGVPLPNFFRKPWGPGWALVGDAGYLKDSITAQGILDAFTDAERCTAALDQAFRGDCPFDVVMSEYQRERDTHALPMFEFTCQLAALAPPPPEIRQLLAALCGNQQLMDRFVQMNAGTISPAEFFAPESVAAMLASGQHEPLEQAQPNA